MIEQLFGSKTRVKLLQLFCSNPNRSFYVREITRKIDEQINSVRRELANLLSIGIISSDNTNNRLYYEVNQNYEHFKALAAIFAGGQMESATTTTDTAGSSNDVRAIKSLGNVTLAIYTGQFTRDDQAGIDVLIVGDINQTKFAKFMAELEQHEGKELRYTAMSAQEYDYRKQVNDRFLATVMAAKKQVLIDKHNELATHPENQEES